MIFLRSGAEQCARKTGMYECGPEKYDIFPGDPLTIPKIA